MPRLVASWQDPSLGSVSLVDQQGLAELSVSDMRTFIREHDPEVRWQARLAARFTRYLDGAALGVEMGSAFDVTPALGQAGWWAAGTAARRRAGLVRELSLLYAGARSCRARRIAEDARDYAARRWRNQEALTSPPPGDVRSVILWKLHRNAASGARWPLAQRQIDSILQSGAPDTANASRHPRDETGERHEPTS